MIVPNLMVGDMGRSIRFYRDTLGMTLAMTVSSNREVEWPGDGEGAAFALLEWEGAQLMLQTAASLSAELPVFGARPVPAPSGTIYFRGLHPDEVLGRLAPGEIVKGPEPTWYGMTELYVSDPDGYVICLGAPEGPPPVRSPNGPRRRRSGSGLTRTRRTPDGRDARR